MNFEEFSESIDLHTQSHRGLKAILIPKWLSNEVKDLDCRIASSAYGETPYEIFQVLKTHLELTPQDLFLDLGAGAGNIVYLALQNGISSMGLERNPNLVQAGEFFLSEAGFRSKHLLCQDFRTNPWPAAGKLFSATTRFCKNTIRFLEEKISAENHFTRAAFLGRPVNLSSDWQLLHSSEHQVRWNHDEALRTERLFIWGRPLRTLPTTESSAQQRSHCTSHRR